MALFVVYHVAKDEVDSDRERERYHKDKTIEATSSTFSLERLIYRLGLVSTASNLSTFIHILTTIPVLYDAV